MKPTKKFSTNIETLVREVEISFYKSSGPGGQRKNKRETAVRIFHPPSGITVIATEHRSQAKNRALALTRLQKKLKVLNKEKKTRKATKMPQHVKEKILQAKKKQSQKKIKRKVHLTTEDEEVY
ncbi:MAG: peptide chain release factor-like protein [Candidatus Cloacimonadota bacterium]|nr:MAG: peptide chain release factor-like protein [Candidatus Cloacimonadota bacterium]